MIIKLYGVRGSCPTPIIQPEYEFKVKAILGKAYEEWKKNPKHFQIDDFVSSLPPNLKTNLGGNTTCAYVYSNAGERIILDCGTGVRVLGNDLVAEGIQPGMTLNILMTHTHWDHIQGWPFFKPAYFPTVNINFYSCISNLQERFERQQNLENFPITLHQMMSKKSFNTLTLKETIQIGSLKITPFALKHPGSCTGYKIEEGKSVFLFCTDVEFTKVDYEASLKELSQILKGADLMMIDAQYSDDEAQKKAGWGHTSMKMAVEFAKAIGVKSLGLTHHEPDHPDQKIYNMLPEEVNLQKEKNIEILLATEGMTFKI